MFYQLNSWPSDCSKICANVTGQTASFGCAPVLFRIRMGTQRVPLASLFASTSPPHVSRRHRRRSPRRRILLAGGRKMRQGEHASRRRTSSSSPPFCLTTSPSPSPPPSPFPLPPSSVIGSPPADPVGRRGGRCAEVRMQVAAVRPLPLPLFVSPPRPLPFSSCPSPLSPSSPPTDLAI